METFWGIVIILALVVGVILWQRMMRAATRKVNQTVFSRKGHREGMALVGDRMDFTTTATVAQIRGALRSGVQLAASRPAVMSDAYVQAEDDTSFVIACGNKLHTSFIGTLELHGTANGTRGMWHIVKWTLADGIVADQSVMKRLNADIRKAVLNADPKANIQVSYEGTT